MKTVIFMFLYYSVLTIYKANGKWYSPTSPSRSHYYYIHSHSSSSSEEAPPAPPPLPAATQQDDDDAKKIVDDKFAEATIASIFSNRNLIHRKVINQQIAFYHKGDRLIEDNFLPNHRKNPPFKDLCFALLNDPITVLTMYLGEFLHRKDETFIIIPLTLCQQMSQLHYIYDQKHKNNLNKRRKKQRHPFSNLMKAWLGLGDRETDTNCNYKDADVQTDADSLKAEYTKWDDHRDAIEYVLIKKCLKFGAAVVEKFEKDVKMTIEEAIKNNIKNHDLVDAYTALALYVKDKYHYMAKILLDHSNGTDRWAVWIMMVGFITGDDWTKIDDAFIKINNNQPLKDFILSNPEPDKVLLQLMAAIIDPTYKPNYQ